MFSGSTGWVGIKIRDVHAELIYAWVRKLQPGIIINNRWDNHGDFSTPETFVPEKAPEGWWESCLQWGKHWGYSPGPILKSDSWVMDKPRIGKVTRGKYTFKYWSRPDGTMQPEFYEHTANLARWMAHSKKSLIGADPFKNWKEISNVPITRKDKEWYLAYNSGKTKGNQLKNRCKACQC